MPGVTACDRCITWGTPCRHGLYLEPVYGWLCQRPTRFWSTLGSNRPASDAFVWLCVICFGRGRLRLCAFPDRAGFLAICARACRCGRLRHHVCYHPWPFLRSSRQVASCIHYRVGLASA